MNDFVSGLRLPADGFRMLRAERRLWLLAAVPTVFSLLAVSAAIALVVQFAGELYALTTAWMPVLEASSWLEWLWVGPAKAGLSVLGALLFAVTAAAAFVVAFLVANLLASPFLDALAQRVEEVASGAVPDSGSGTLAEILRSLREELRRIAFYVSIAAPLAAIGVVIPGAQLVTAPILVAFTVLFLPLDYAGYALDRRRLSFREKRLWLQRHRGATLGFGIAAFAMCLIPGLGFIAMPVLVTAGTLLVLRRPPGAVNQARDAARGTATSP